jgi:hypothetical protein
MHLEILNDKQKELLPLISQFKRSFYLVGGTAIALHLGHRESIDFDLFSYNKLNKSNIKQKISSSSFQKYLIFEDVDQLHYNIHNVKLTFFQYPYSIEHQIFIHDIITIPSLLSLSAMKAFALGRRAKWKDYVDLYFILKDHFTVEEISIEAIQVFPDQFSEKLFRQQLSFHKDIDYSEAVRFLPGFEVKPDEIKQFLIDKAIEISG